MNVKARKFARNLIAGHGKKDSAILAGYSPKTAQVTASRLVKSNEVIKVFNQMGLTDEVIAKGLKTNFQEGIGVKATADTSVKIAEMVFRLKGYLDKDTGTTNNTQINIQQLNNLSETELQAKIDSLTSDLQDK